MGISGIWLYFYLFIHLAGNLAMFAGPEKFNKYGHLLLGELGELIFPVEMSLLAAFILHVVLAIQLQRENRKARPQAYAVKVTEGKKTLYSATMFFTGMWLLFFIIIHILHFRYGAVTGGFTVVYDGVEMHDLYRTMMEGFGVWWYSLAYVLTLLLLGSHIAHGVQSSIQTLGFNHPKYTPFVHWFSRGYAILIAGGFSFMAIWGYFQHVGQVH